jgi:hypothetical protein
MGGIAEAPNISRRARSPDPARAKPVLGESRGRASLDSCARRDPVGRAIPPKIKESEHVTRESNTTVYA